MPCSLNNDAGQLHRACQNGGAGACALGRPVVIAKRREVVGARGSAVPSSAKAVQP
ncbi:hypothetical protein C4J93_1978 [Pseudomonas sp. R2-37-08W]|nr:hypothetical protein C4J93_1978 [Pseudomonas sp. R2-37-08W]